MGRNHSSDLTFSYVGWQPFGSVWNYLALLLTNICHKKLSHFFFLKMAQEGIFLEFLDIFGGLFHLKRHINAVLESTLGS